MINWKAILEGAIKKAVLDGTDSALVAAAGATADVISKHLRGPRGVRFAGLLFAEVFKRAGYTRQNAIEFIPL